MSMHRIHNRAAGFSLIELMIAVTLGLLLLLGLLQVFGATKSGFNASMATAQIQETGRYALETLKPVLRGAGSNGFCAGELPVNSHLNNTTADPACPAWVDDVYAAGRALTGWEFDGTGASEVYTMASLSPAGVNVNKWDSLQPDETTLDLPAPLAGLVVPGTDVLVLRTLEPVPNVTAVGNTQASASAINLTGKHGTGGDAILLVTNCTDAADLFQNNSAANATAINRGTGSCTNPGPGNVAPGGRSWSTKYDNRMQIFRVRLHAYYIGLDADTGEPGLYRFDLSASAKVPEEDEEDDRIVELVRGVENMQLRYGLSLPGADGGDGQSVNSWLTADRVTDWNLIIAVHMSLLVRSDDAPDGQSVQQTLNMAGTSIRHMNDNRLRRRFNATVALRNRILVL